MDKASSGKGPDPAPEKESREVSTPPHELSDSRLLNDCRVDTFRAGGKGGQHQNKTETGVRITHLPTGTTAVARDRRSQSSNRTIALDRLRAKLADLARVEAPRRATRVPLKERRKRVDDKKRRARLKRLRRKPSVDDA
ncbi:MAG: peptide chain release factor-like protein [Gemmatimonadetes bacterium]|nr:peptide chain release factor-like protein [Gemmatimonadota bacterium]